MEAITEMSATKTKATKSVPPFSQATIEAVASILGDTDEGLTNAEIEMVLSAIRLRDPRAEAEARSPAVRQGLMWVKMSKRERISMAILRQQKKQQTGGVLVAFINEAMNLHRYGNDHDRHRRYQAALNGILVLEGLRVNDEGKVAKSPKASSLSEAALIAGSLTTELRRRGAHDLALRYCTAEIVDRDLFHAVHEAVKGICDRLRAMSNSALDGHQLVDFALTRERGTAPAIKLNPLGSQADWNEQTGLAHLIKGLVSRYRNPTSHQTRLLRQAKRPILERELLETLTAVSLVHHALDSANSMSTP